MSERHNLKQAQNGSYYCADELGMMCAGNWTDSRSWDKHVAHWGVKPSRVYGIAWTRGEVVEPIQHEEVQWFDTYGEALAEFNSRDDKYWPSVLVRASLGPVAVERRGTCPEWLNDPSPVGSVGEEQ